MNDFFTQSPLWHLKIGEIHALLERVKISEEQHSDVLRLRKYNRILSIHASTAIEGNILTPRQVQDVINGKPVLGPPKDIKEVQNAWAAYDLLEKLNPYSSGDLLKAHTCMTAGLVEESGAYRTCGVVVARSDGTILHQGAPYQDVPYLTVDLLDWAAESSAHPLIKSSVVHFMLEHIHPFRDGNGRIGQLWQTLILSKWNPLFAWMPVETLVHDNQALYYRALRESHQGTADCRPFIDFMIDAIENSLYKYVDIATETKNGGIEAETRPIDPINDLINDPIKVVLEAIKRNPRITYDELAVLLEKSTATVKRIIKILKQTGKIIRVGSNKTGYWEVLG
jgi:Fic family protein